MKIRSFNPGNAVAETLMHEIHVSHFTNIEAADPVNLPHRDADYMLLFQKKGYFSLMVDDDLIEMHDRSVYFILPGQLRHHVASQTESWILAVNASFLQ